MKAEATTAQSSISQIRDTLHNLLRSIEDNGRDADALFGKRQQWCESGLHSFETEQQAKSASLEDMQARLTESEAEVEEAEGTVQQVQVDIEMVQHTIRQTQDMFRDSAGSRKGDADLIASLADNKQMSLASLQGELEIAEPVLAQLQAGVAETKQRISYRTDSVSAAGDFLGALKAACQSSSDRADSQAAARVGESNALHAALQVLDTYSHSQPSSDDKDQSFTPLSFVQTQEVTTDDLSDIFAAAQEAKPVHKAPPARRHSRAEHGSAKVTALRPRIQTLLTQLKGQVDNSEQASWCAKQRENSEMALKFAQDSVAQISSELDAHADLEAELADDLTKLKASNAQVTAAAKNVFSQATKERTLIQSTRKDQQLAIKILEQATTIMKELNMDGSKKVVDSLESAKGLLANQIASSSAAGEETKNLASGLGDKALALTRAQESEQHDIEYARDDHASQRLRSEENKRLYEADVQEASSYAQKLDVNCKFDAEEEAKQQRVAQVHALEDASKALQGKLLAAKSASNSLRGVDANHPNTAPQNLTPMQRAAMEMGISTE
jgi:chromosome segregation ATPase